MPRPTPQLPLHFTPIPTPTSFCVYFNLCFFDFDTNSENDTDFPFFTSMPSLTSTLTPCLHPPSVRFSVPITPTGWKSHVWIPPRYWSFIGFVVQGRTIDCSLKSKDFTSDSTFNQPTHTVRPLIRIRASIRHPFRHNLLPSPHLPHF
jgi:hypothetical protein